MGDSVLVHDFLTESARRYPDKVATIYRDECLTYSELENLSGALASNLRKNEVKGGDRVALLLDNSHEFIIAFFGVLKAGAAVVPIEVPIVARELLCCLDDCTPKAILTDPARHSLVRDALEKSNRPPTVIVVERSSLATSHDGNVSMALSETRPSPEALACLLYTSGTTGEPKGVMLSHANFVANADSIVQYLDLEPDDRTMLVMPLTHSYGLSILTTRFKVGGTVIVDNRFTYPNVVLDAMRELEATGFAGVPSHYAMLLRRSALRKYELPSLRYVTQAGGPLPPPMIQEFMDIFPNLKFYVMYGQTEASARLSYLEPDLLPRKMGSIGKGIPGVELTVLNEGGRPVEPGETGEITARGKNLMLGYWNSPEETALVLRDSRLFTGDLARVDSDGYIYIVGREKEMLKSGGHRISPLEIEEVVCTHAGITECAAVGMPDELFGEVIRLFVVLGDSPGVEKEEIEALCKLNLAPHKVPRQIEFVSSLPKTASGKIKRTELKLE